MVNMDPYGAPGHPSWKKSESKHPGDANPYSHMQPMVLEYESHHLPQKLSGCVAKYTIHGAYGLGYDV